MKVYEIHPGLYQRGLFDGYSDARKEAFLDALGIRMVACLVAKPDEPLRRIMEAAGSEYVYLPIPDGKLEAGTVERLREVACRQATLIRGGAAVVNHCRAGRNRSALLSALTYRILTGSTGQEARLAVQKARPAALANEHFCAYLDSLGRPQ